MRKFKNIYLSFLLDQKLRSLVTTAAILTILFGFVNTSFADGLSSDAAPLKTIGVWALGIGDGLALLWIAWQAIQHSMALASGVDQNAKSKLVACFIGAGICCGVFYLITLIATKSSEVFGTTAKDIIPNR